jgi:hypothetical protein
MHRFLRLFGSAAVAAVLLSGCAGGFLLDNQVEAFSKLAAMPPQPTYRFDRLPSQNFNPSQPALEALADPALHKAGLRRNDADPRYSVQVSAITQQSISPYVDPWSYGGGLGVGYGRGGGVGISLGGPLYPRMNELWFHREVRVIVRDLSTSQVVFETHATNDGPWLDNRAILPVMFEAAMNGFPTPPPGPRRVDIHVGGS